jgi:hypothetical protein
MKYLFVFTAFLFADMVFPQSGFPVFLQGTWKMENREIYEHWDQLNEQSLKGFSYTVKEDQIAVIEYLDIIRNKDEIIYTATVLDQNKGKGVEFKLIGSDSAFLFENTDHDFPKQILYKKISPTEIFVQVSGGKENGFSYRMAKQNRDKAANDSTISNPNYNRTLADKLGADDYGMKSYWFVILKTGANDTKDQEFIAESFRGHLDNINRLVEDGKLVVAGPLGKNNHNYRGIFILNNIGTAEEAKELLLTDPAIKNGLLDIEVFNWYGSAALPEYLPFSDQIWKINP